MEIKVPPHQIVKHSHTQNHSGYIGKVEKHQSDSSGALTTVPSKHRLAPTLYDKALNFNAFQ